MNPRRSGRPLPRRSAPAILLAVAALASSYAPARAGCGGRESRPTAPLGWPTPASARHGADLPACSGPSRSRTPPSAPAVAIRAATPRPDLFLASPADPAIAARPGRPIASRERLSPIGRVTDVDRPPSGGR